MVDPTGQSSNLLVTSDTERSYCNQGLSLCVVLSDNLATSVRAACPVLEGLEH